MTEETHTKRVFLVVYDYQTGGVWGLVTARSPAEIEARYCDLAVVDKIPAWMTEDVYQRIASTSSWDIDDPSPPDWVTVRSPGNASGAD